MSAQPDLTPKEQTNVRAALAFLRLRCGGWGPLAKLVKFKDTSLGAIHGGDKIVSPTLAFRIARIAKVGMDDGVDGGLSGPWDVPPLRPSRRVGVEGRQNTSLVTDARPGRTDTVGVLFPGAHVAVFAHEDADLPRPLAFT